MAQYRLNDSLGLDDARKCNELGAHLSLVPADLVKGKLIELSDAVKEYLTGPTPRGKGYTNLLLDPATHVEPAHAAPPVHVVRGEALPAEITAPKKPEK